MELCESVQRGLQLGADPTRLDRTGFQALLDSCFRSLLSSQGDPAVLDEPELENLDRVQLKEVHAATVTFILEAARQDADGRSISSSLEELSFSAERAEMFCGSFQKHKEELRRLLASMGRGPAQISDVSWRLQLNTKSEQLHQVNRPLYLISLSTENRGSSDDVSFTCTTEQLQDLLGKFKDAAKSLEKASQM